MARKGEIGLALACLIGIALLHKKDDPEVVELAEDGDPYRQQLADIEYRKPTMVYWQPTMWERFVDYLKGLMSWVFMRRK